MTPISRRHWIAAALAASWTMTAAQSARTINWDALVPQGWDPLKDLRALMPDQTPGRIAEGSPAEAKMMLELRRLWDAAPTVAELAGQQLRLPGYVVPLERAGDDKLKEFLLVPYFGACIHSPPPPANQIVLVSLAKPAPLRTMDTVWVTGTMRVDRSDSPMGVSGYRLEQARSEAYQAERR